jgi:hypothetical protein
MSSTEIAFQPSKLKFLSGLGYAIYIAAFDLDKAQDPELVTSGDVLEARAEAEHHHHSLHPTTAITVAAPTVSKSTGNGSVRGNSQATVAAYQKDRDLEKKSTMSEQSESLRNQQLKSVYVYPILSLPIKHQTRDNLTLDDFNDVKHIADGSNANIFLAMLGREKVVIKMIKVEAEYDPIAIEEFELERAVLTRLDHPTIIRVHGSGSTPRRFIVLEYLAGGSLNTLLNENLAKPGLAQKLFRKPSFTYLALLQAASEMAQALDYLHSKCYVGASLLHRGTCAT